MIENYSREAPGVRGIVAKLTLTGFLPKAGQGVTIRGRAEGGEEFSQIPRVIRYGEWGILVKLTQQDSC